jgi:hypothetical protein
VWKCSKPNFEESSVLKPGGKLEDVTKGCETLSSEDVVVFVAGTNDISHIEGDNFISALQRKVRDLRHTKVIVFNIPHRYDLQSWSCVNNVVDRVNSEIFKLGKYLRNVSVVDLSRLGSKFHTRQDLHLNDLENNPWQAKY